MDFSIWFLYLQSWTKVLGHFGVSVGRFPIHTGPTPTPILSCLPSPHKQCWTHISRIVSEFQLCIGWGGGRTARKFQKGCTVLRGNREMTEKYEYCSSYCPKDLCPGLSESWFWGKRLLSSFFLCFLGILETSSWSHAIIMTFETISST